MARRRKISSAERRHIDYLRRKAMATAKVYGGRLKRERRKEVKRILSICADNGKPEEWGGIVQTAFSEASYYRDIMSGLYLSVGMDRCKSTARDINRAKADASAVLNDHWLNTLNAFARSAIGERIVIVQDTAKDTLRRCIGNVLEELGNGVGIEKLVQSVYSRYTGLDEWEIRRIMQTETMIGTAKAGEIAADSLEVEYRRIWVTSGLANTRDSHLALDGVVCEGMDAFDVGNSKMMYPHDSSMNPEVGEIINCACDVLREPI